LKKPATNTPFAIFFPVIAAAFASTLTMAAAQTAPAATPAPTPSAPAPSAPAQATGQIGPGTTGTISNSEVTPFAPGHTPKIFQGPLSSKTRQTLQEAMNSVTPPPASVPAPANATAPAVTNAPPVAAGH